MLTISAIKNSGGAAKYYSKEDNYYLSEVDAKEASLWIGAGAVRLGLNGKVEERALQELLNGKLPNGQIIGLQKDGTINHRAGYDLCFQAPKSVSILALDGGDKRLYAAHLGAIKETLKIIERDCAQAKVYRNEKIHFENTKNLTVALIAHTTSRKLDLHLHHHALVMNFTQRQDNAWRALASSRARGDQVNGFFERIHKHQIYYGLIYKTALANKVMQLGHEIEIVGPHGLWEIKGVPKEAREIMSKRRQEIEKRIKELNYRSLKAADLITLNTREKKPSKISLDTIRQSWKSELSAIGFASKEYLAELDKRQELNTRLKNRDTGIIELKSTSSAISINAKTAVHDAIEHLSQYNLKLEYPKIVSLALEFSVGNTTHKDVIYALDDVIQTKRLIPLDQSDSLFVTKELIETEKTIMDLVRNGVGTGYPLKFKEEAVSSVASGEIKKQVLKVLQAKNRIHLIEHTAKDNTGFMSAVLKLAESSGKTVKVLSPNRMLTNDINETIRRKPNNLWQWLVALGKPEVGECIAGFIHKYQEEITTSLLGFRQGKEVFIVNNAETLGTGDLKSLLELTKKTSARVIFLRDLGIRTGFCAGNSMVTLKHAGVETIVFNSDDSRLGKVTKRTPELIVVASDEERTKKLTTLLALQKDDARINTLVFVGSKTQVKTTNQAIRDELKNLGKLSNLEYKIRVLNPIYLSRAEGSLAHKYQKDLVIRFYHKRRPPEDWIVESSYKESNRLSLRFDRQDGYYDKSSVTNIFKRTSRQTWNPKHKTNHRVFKREILNISAGDKLIATAKMGNLGINHADRFTVTEVNESHIRLSSVIAGRGSITKIKLRLKELQNSHFDYDYATTLSKYSQKQVDHVIADFKAYTLDKPTLNELNLRAKEYLTLFTNEVKTIQNRFNYLPTKLTAIEAILDASKVDRFISDKTVAELKSDIELAISTLTNNDSAAKKAVDFAIEKITARTAGFAHKELVIEALNYALRDQAATLGKEVTHEEIMKVIMEKRGTGELIMGKYFEDGTRWTTKAILALERSIIATLKNGKDKLEPLVAEELSSQALENTQLTQDQKNACHLITTTKDQFVIIQGYAGAGKTTLFAQVQNMLKNASTHKELVETAEVKKISANNISIEMLALAPTHRAVKELKNVGIPAQTLKSFLVERKLEPRTTPVITALNNKLIILDEASMVSNKDFDRFLRVISDTKTHVVFSGDIAQHLAIESGKPFEIAQRLGILKTAYLKEIVRQKNPALKEVVESIIQGDYSSAFEKVANENPQNYIKRLETPNEKLELEAIRGSEKLSQGREPKNDGFFAALKSSIVEIDNNKLKFEEKTLEERVAEDYLSRTPEVRDQTVIIVHANRDRRVITNIIRDGLKNQGEIDKNGLEVNCLISKGLTDPEHNSLGSYNIGDMVKLGKEYYRVVAKEPAIKSLLLKDEVGKTRYFYPEKQADKYNIGLYECTAEELAIGDTIRLTKTDRERERYASSEYKVVAVNDEAVTLRSKDNENRQLIFRPKELRDAHWDYAQTVTGYGIQGGSKTYAIDFEVSYRKNLANQRSFYIGASRAIQHLIIYTDNKKRFLDRILTNKGDKYSALEVIGDINLTNNNKNKDQNKYIKQSTLAAQSNKKTSMLEQVTAQKTQTISGHAGFTEHKIPDNFYSSDFKEIESTINASTEVLVERILGQPNQKLSTAAEWRYGNKGSLAIRMAGDKKGLWHNFETGEAGNLISLIKKETGLSFTETLQYVTNLPGVTKLYISKNQHPRSVIEEQNSPSAATKEVNTKDYAVKLAKESQPINGTIAEKYLKKIRGIKNINSPDIRYHPKVYTGKNENQKYLPAMLSIGRDKDGNIKCVQATYLDPKTTNKADINIKKRTYASPSEAAVLLQKSNSKNKISYITEGVETGLSIKDAIKAGDVFATLGKSNFMTLDPIKLGQRVIFCLDNDGKNIYNDEIIYKAAARLINLKKEVFISIPHQINNQKTDFNDVVRIGGTKAVKYYLDHIKSYDKNAKQFEMLSKIQDKSETQQELSLNNKQFEYTK